LGYEQCRDEIDDGQEFVAIQSSISFLHSVSSEAKRQHPQFQFLRTHVMLMMATVAILMAAHVTEVLVWAATCAMVGATPAGASHVYLAFVSYTTLGYGDVVPVSAWQLLGPLTAMNGILLFGWSTAVIFEVVRTAVRDIPR
jgi:hypothetical protein